MHSNIETQSFNHYTATNQIIPFDNDWKFTFGDVPNASHQLFDDSSWQTIKLPHDFSLTQDYAIYQGEAESGYKLGGVGWYRKYFTLGGQAAKGRFLLCFDGSYMETEVYVNGQKLGMHPNGYSHFSYDITDFLTSCGDNTLAIKVTNKIPSSRWYSGSGIYRSLYLEVTPQVHLRQDGVTVKTPNLAETYRDHKTAQLLIEAEVINQSDNAITVSVKTSLYPKTSDIKTQALLSHQTKEQTIEQGKEVTFKHDLSLINPDLWSISHPNLYVLRTELLDRDGQIIHQKEEEVGFRFIAFDAQKGFYLNGQAVKLQGVCMHHDQGALGAKAYYDAIDRQLTILKDMGVNAVRVTHNPSSRFMRDIANRKGILLVDEAFDTWRFAKNGNQYDYARFFDQKIGENANYLSHAKPQQTWAEYHIKQMVRAGKNAPSLIMWSTGNEVQEGLEGDNQTDSYPKLLKDLINWVAELDQSRPVTLGDNKLKNEGGTERAISLEMAKVLSTAKNTCQGIVGYNYASGCDYDRDHKEHPDWKMYGSETASAINSRGVYNASITVEGHSAYRNEKNQLSSYDNSTVGWGHYASEAWFDVITRDFVAGEFVWTGFDYLGEPTPWNSVGKGPANQLNGNPPPKSSYFGIIDTAGFPKDSYYFYRSQWQKEDTTLHILPSWKESILCTSGNAQKVTVVVYSNADAVELCHTDMTGKKQLLGKRNYSRLLPATDNIHSYRVYEASRDTAISHKNLYLTWEIPYQEGTLEAIAYDKKGKIITETHGNSKVRSFGQPNKLHLTTSKCPKQVSDNSLAYVEISVQDQDGHDITDASNRITVSVTGPARLLALDNGDPTDHQSYQDNNRQAFAGKLLAIVQMTGDSGQVLLKATSKGVKAAKQSIKVYANKEPKAGAIDRYDMVKNLYIKKGRKTLPLPKTVLTRRNNGEEKLEDIIWDKSSLAEKLKKELDFTINGRLASSDKPISINVFMIGQVVAIKTISILALEGESILLPETVQAYLANGQLVQSQFPVIWENKPEDLQEKLQSEPVVTVKGIVDVLGDKKEACANIRLAQQELKYSSIDVSKSAQKTVDTTSVTYTYATAENIARLILPTSQTASIYADGQLVTTKVPKKTSQGLEYCFTAPVSAVQFKIVYEGVSSDYEKIKLFRGDWLVTKAKKAWLDRISVEGVDYLLSQKGITDIPTHSGSLDVSKISVHKNPYHCAITILPEYQNEVKILVASEDMKQEKMYRLKACFEESSTTV
ncbi:beta-galactosidase [Streptococcus iniae]|uniref:glycoside hydrolase family 2 TIM barrel-domain containing protein n=1 Tax=Streptococcus iniae TaxID=1346 RepID=UPI000EF655FF|nr:glycoside hydrolase family 2 TIM barrel-domain containing protein [Streptococcus iniae]RLV27240.1 beta-galactosidase [Streptococcus iniae]